jgi:hypothetical protein
MGRGLRVECVAFTRMDQLFRVWKAALPKRAIRPEITMDRRDELTRLRRTAEQPNDLASRAGRLDRQDVRGWWSLALKFFGQTTLAENFAEQLPIEKSLKLSLI